MDAIQAMTARGFTVQHLGGGVTAWTKRNHLDNELRVTNGDFGHCTSLSDYAVLGVYNREYEVIAMTEYETLGAMLKAIDTLTA